MPDQPLLRQLALQRPRLGNVLFFLFGCLTMLAFAPVGWFPLAILLVLPFLFACLYLSPRRAAWLGFWYGCGLFLTGTYWLYTSIHVIGHAPLAVAIFIMLALVTIMGLYYALTAWLISRLSAGSPLRLLAAAPAAWVAVEWLRGWLLSGFPWMSLGYSQIDSPLAGIAPIAGVYGLSAALLTSASAFIVAIVSVGQRRAVFALLAFTPWLGGLLLQQLDWSRRLGPDVRITIVQGGIPQEKKWLPEQFQPTLDLYRSSIDANKDSQLIVWPEVALPAITYQVESELQQLQREMRRNNQSLLLGILEWQGAEEPIYNSVMMLDGRSRQMYRKRHLVPFGEYFPVPDFIRGWMRMMSLPHTDLGAGKAEQPLLVTAAGTQLAIAICYEDAYAAEQLYAMPEASILINVSNDAWFGDSIAPHQHLEIARMRALELSRYVVRSTNNGISAFIGPDGAVLERGAQFEYVTMTRDITPLGGLTVYARFGNWPVIAVCLLLLAGLVVRKSRKSTVAGAGTLIA